MTFDNLTPGMGEYLRDPSPYDMQMENFVGNKSHCMPIIRMFRNSSIKSLIQSSVRCLSSIILTARIAGWKNDKGLLDRG